MPLSIKPLMQCICSRAQEPESPPSVGCFSTGGNCLTADSTSCRGKPDGHYQACEGCNIYHSCSGGVIWANRDCPLTNYGGLNGRLVWTQVTPTAGRCEYSSSICSEHKCNGHRVSRVQLQQRAHLKENDTFFVVGIFYL